MDLSTSYLGMKLRTPLVPSASPLSRNIDDVKRLEDAGAAAVVFHSVFEEQLGTSPKAGDFRVGPELYLGSNHDKLTDPVLEMRARASVAWGGWRPSWTEVPTFMPERASHVGGASQFDQETTYSRK